MKLTKGLEIRRRIFAAKEEDNDAMGLREGFVLLREPFLFLFFCVCWIVWGFLGWLVTKRKARVGRMQSGQDFSPKSCMVRANKGQPQEE